MAAIALHSAIGGSSPLYDGIAVTSAIAIAGAIVLYRPATWRGWVTIVVAQTLYAAGDIAYDVFPSATMPGVSDGFYLAGCATFAVGVLLLMGQRFVWRDIAGHVDALLITVALGMSLWLVLLDKRVAVSFTASDVTAFAYPLADLLVVGLLIRIAIAPGRHKVAFWLMFASLVPLVVADLSYVVPALADSYQPGGWLDTFWLANYVLLGTSALHPSMGSLADVDSGGEALPTHRVIAGGLALALLPVSALIEHFTRGNPNVALLGVGGTIVIGGMVARTVVLVRALDRLRHRAEESERRFRMVFERAPIGISLGRNGMMTETNPALQRMLGYSAAELARKHYSGVTVADAHARAIQADLDAGGRDAFTVEKQYVCRDGSLVDTRLHVVRDVADGLGMALIEDVTQQRALEAQVVHAQKMDAIGKLAGGVAHDFNNLMTAVIGYSDLLLRGGEPEPVRRAKLTAIRDAAVRASDLTQQLLAFSRRQVMRADEIDLRDVVNRMDIMLRRLLGEQIRLETILAAEPVIVRADPLQLEQVVLNLVLNAREAMPEGGTLTVAVLSNGEEAVLAVADDGTGMDEETQARIFEPFFTTKPLADGSGLGLSTVHGIVGQSGGAIEVASRPGHGSTFTVTLPAAGAERLPGRSPLATVVD
jgi:PAS domain S-box-containing protein